MHTRHPLSTLLVTTALMSVASLAAAQTGMSTEGAMPQARHASGAEPMANSDKSGKPAVDKMSTPTGTSKKPAKAGAQSGPSSAPK